MFLFKKSDEAKHDMILMSLGRALQNSPNLTDEFYKKLFASSEEIKSFFKSTIWEEQNIRLKAALGMVVMFDVEDEDAVKSMTRLQKSHGKHGMKVHPHLYNDWETCMLSILKESDTEFNKELEKEWVRVIRKAVKFISADY